MSRPRLGITLAWLFLPAAFGLLQRGWTKAAVALMLSCLTAILLSGDRLAFLFAVAGLALAAACLPAVRRRARLFALAAMVLIVGVLIVKPDVYSRQISSTVESVRHLGTTHYGVIWQRALTIAHANPLFGVGMNRYRSVCENATYGPVAQSSNNLPACAGHPHNLYLEWLVENGIVALAGFVAAMALVGRRFQLALPVLRENFLFVALAVTLALRLFPASTATSMTRSWFSMPLWLVLGWGLALAIAATPAHARSKT